MRLSRIVERLELLYDEIAGFEQQALGNFHDHFCAEAFLRPS